VCVCVCVCVQMSVDNCYYQGQVRRLLDSTVAISLCHGIRFCTVC